MIALRFQLKPAGVISAIALASAALVTVLLGNDRSGSEEYAVYSAYIEDGLTGDSHSLGVRGGMVLIADHAPADSEPLRFFLGSLVNLSRRAGSPRLPLLAGLFLKNLRRHKLDRRLTISADYELLDSASLYLLDVQRKFPQSFGFLTFSSVSFSLDPTEALFYVEHLCGLCGVGEYVLMRKHRGIWFVANRYITWVS